MTPIESIMTILVLGFIIYSFFIHHPLMAWLETKNLKWTFCVFINQLKMDHFELADWMHRSQPTVLTERN